MTKTPLTDFAFQGPINTRGNRLLALAEKLEIQLAEARAEIAELRAVIDKVNRSAWSGGKTELRRIAILTDEYCAAREGK